MVFGGAGDDSIDTGRGPDLIVAGDGFDTIAAGLGDDRIFLAGGSGGDRATDRLVVDDPRDSFFGIPSGWSSDMVFDFQPLSRMGADSAGQADKIDLTALLQAYDASGVAAGDSRYYSAANPFDAGHLRLTAVGGSTRVEINDPAAGWRSFLTLVGVGSDELSTTVQADLSSGLAAASGGDFLWYVG
ncbi:MAG: hypothetical protein HY778_10955 [Betaproteobacteria bacterium]|nr:hypothetical protein [Betaproteobacteria bacterium]